MMARHPVIEGRVRAVGRGGEAVVETEQGVVFVPGGLPEERLRLELGRDKRGAKRGRLAAVLEASPGRRQPACAWIDRCGGCPLMIADSSLQRRIKEGFLREACKGLPSVRGTDVDWVDSKQPLGYRRRARFAWDRDTFGYRRRGSNRVVDIHRCIVVAEPIQDAWNQTRQALGAVLGGRGEIQLALSDGGVVVDVQADEAQSPDVFAACAALAERDGVEGVALRGRDEGVPAAWGTTTITLRGSDGEPLSGPAGAFTQANDSVNAALVERVVEFADPADMQVLELFCGIGNFTVALARHAASLVALEQHAAAAHACRANLAARGLRARVTEGNANQPPKGRYDVIVLDPPRQGARELFEASEQWKKAKRIVYVSCDTATLGRDLRIACGEGFRIDRIAAFDMFPQTAHVENVVRLIR